MPRVTDEEVAKMILGRTDEDGLWDYEYVRDELPYLHNVADVWIITDRKI